MKSLRAFAAAAAVHGSAGSDRRSWYRPSLRYSDANVASGSIGSEGRLDPVRVIGPARLTHRHIRDHPDHQPVRVGSGRTPYTLPWRISPVDAEQSCRWRAVSLERHRPCGSGLEAAVSSTPQGRWTTWLVDPIDSCNKVVRWHQGREKRRCARCKGAGLTNALALTRLTILTGWWSVFTQMGFCGWRWVGYPARHG